MHKPNKARIEQVCALRALGLTLEAIGGEIGCTRERVRQLLVLAESLMPELYANSIASHANATAKPEKGPRIVSFKPVVYRWLFECGYIRCIICKDVLCKDEFCEAVASGRQRSRICRGCGRLRMENVRLTNPNVRLKQKAWQAANPDKSREYARRWYNKHKDIAAACQKKRYDTLMSTEDGRKKLDAQKRLYMGNRKKKSKYEAAASTGQLSTS